jgi:hypothetical protein
MHSLAAVGVLYQHRAEKVTRRVLHHNLLCAVAQARGRVPSATGVWVGARKLGAVGVRISHGVSSHGLAFNVSPDLSAFDNIVPCGSLAADAVTSLAREMSRASSCSSSAAAAAASKSSPSCSECSNGSLLQAAENVLQLSLARALGYTQLLHVPQEQLMQAAA